MNSPAKKALFLDRDGVINTPTPGYVWQPRDFVFIPEIFDIVAQAQQLGYLIIVITNQGGIAKGLYTIADVQALHSWADAQFAEKHLKITAWYFSPHHHTIGNSLTRKPKTLLFERACALHQVDPGQSWMIGDSRRDLIPAKKLGMQTIMVGPENCPEADYFTRHSEVLTLIR